MKKLVTLLALLPLLATSYAFAEKNNNFSIPSPGENWEKYNPSHKANNMLNRFWNKNRHQGQGSGKTLGIHNMFGDMDANTRYRFYMQMQLQLEMEARMRAKARANQNANMNQHYWQQYYGQSNPYYSQYYYQQGHGPYAYPPVNRVIPKQPPVVPSQK